MSIEQMDFLKNPPIWKDRIKNEAKEILNKQGYSEEEVEKILSDENFFDTVSQNNNWENILANSEDENIESELAKGLALQIKEKLNKEK